MRVNYLSLKGYFILLVLSLQLVNAKAQQVYTYSYTGAVQTANLPAGSYSVAVWGADGGSGTNSAGGKGGYSQGTFTLSGATTYYIYVGGKGISSGATGALGGWNGGGGFTGSFTSPTVCGTGGGGSDIRTTQNTTYANRIIVAGGGGGGNGYSSYTGVGGNGGGTSGMDGTTSRGVNYSGGGGTAVAGGTAGIAGISGYSAAGALGVGGDFLGTLGGTAGGGGYYGGGSGHWGRSGGGGSGYVGGVSNGVTMTFTQAGFVTNPDVTGNGRVIITELCSISLTASGSNSLNPSICSGQSLTLTTNGISNYAWSTGNTTNSTIVVSPTATTVYTLSATSPSNCTASKSMTVIVNSAAPVLTLTASPSTNSICLGQTATLTAAGAVSYTWAGGAGNVTNAVTFTPTATANYTVTGVNGCGTTTAAATMSVLPLPVVAAASSTLVCSATPVTLTASGANTYTWTTQTSTNTSSTYIVNPAGNTTYSLVGVTGPCSGVTTINITTKALPTLTITPSATTICQGNSVSLNASGTATSYVWNPGGQSGTSISVSPTTTTLYSVIGTNTNNCVNSTNQVVIVNANPSVNASAINPVVCSGGSATLSASGAGTYAWSSGGTTTVTVVNPTANSVYTVTGTNANNCNGTATVGVNVFVPSVNVSGGAAICAGTGTVISASGADSYHWSNGTSLASNNVSPTLTTVYTVTGSVTDPVSSIACPATNTVLVTVNANPTVVALADHSVICLGNSAVLTAGGASTYTWTGGSGAVQAITNTVTPIANQTYSVTGTDPNGCKSATIIAIQVAPCLGIASISGNAASLQIYPNPGNGEITISSDQAITLQITSELGQLIGTVSISNTEKEAKLNNLGAGVYFITGHNANGSVKQKLIITK